MKLKVNNIFRKTQENNLITLKNKMKMKNIKVLMIALIVCFISCKKDEAPEPPQQCNCGVIANDGITNGCYWLEIRNDCSGNKKSFCFDEDVWMNNFVGDRFCVSNVSSW